MPKWENHIYKIEKKIAFYTYYHTGSIVFTKKKNK